MEKKSIAPVVSTAPEYFVTLEINAYMAKLMEYPKKGEMPGVQLAAFAETRERAWEKAKEAAHKINNFDDIYKSLKIAELLLRHGMKGMMYYEDYKTVLTAILAIEPDYLKNKDAA